MVSDCTDLANAMLESKGLQDSADELWLDFVAIPKSERYARWTPRPPGYRRGWGHQLAESARFEAMPIKLASGEDAVGVVLREPSGDVFVAWFGAARGDEARVAVARLNEEIVAIWHHWRGFGEGCVDAQRQLTFEQGHEHAPDARWGLQVLTLADDGRFAYLQRRAGRVIAMGSGAVDPERARGVFDHLARSTFPEVASHPFPPGASVLTISMPPDRTVALDRRFGLGLDGYREAISELMTMTAEARSATETRPPAGKGLSAGAGP